LHWRHHDFLCTIFFK